jgi:DNA-binding response OmpR family regulator
MTMTKSPTIVVVEDDENVAEVFVEWVNLSGISVLAHGYDGREAVQLFEKYRPDVMVLDLMMPRFDGFYAIEGIRKIDPNAKILVLTADIAENTKTKLMEIEKISLVYKPYDLDEVVNEIKRLANEVIVL